MDRKQGDGTRQDEPIVIQEDTQLEGVSGGDGGGTRCPQCGGYRYVYRQSVGGLICLDCDYTIW